MNNKYPIKLNSFEAIFLANDKTKVLKYLRIFLLMIVIFMFLPWTQNIKSKGNITTLDQANRPQKVNSPIPGKIKKWYVKEGDFIKKGDTILILSEIKEDYLDPNLINRTQNQLDAKKRSVDFYNQKIQATEMQISNLEQSQKLKIEQLKNKIQQLNNKLVGEKAELLANENETKLLKNQYERQLKMYEDGLVSQTQLQQRNIQYQNATAKKIATENKIEQTKQELINIKLEQSSALQEYSEKINKATGDKYQNMSIIATTQADLQKIENQVVNYTIRNNMYIVTAPQDGQVIQTNKSGIGEILKDGETISMIVPTRIDYAVEIFVKPMDLPLIQINQNIRFTFDGYPAIVFSGWPKNSYGTFSGKVAFIESNVSENGLFRVLVSEDNSIKKWPNQLKIGTGAQAIIILNDVPIWYELWRNINGFPADFYKIENDAKKNKK